jgi:hypothetical protein
MTPEQLQGLGQQENFGPIRNFGQSPERARQEFTNDSFDPTRFSSNTRPELAKAIGDLNLQANVDQWGPAAAQSKVPAADGPVNPADPVTPAQSVPPQPKFVLHGSNTGVEEWMNPAIQRLADQGRSEGLFKGPDGQIRRIIYKGQRTSNPGDPAPAGAAGGAPAPAANPSPTQQDLTGKSTASTGEPFNVGASSPFTSGSRMPSGGWVSQASGVPMLDTPDPRPVSPATSPGNQGVGGSTAPQQEPPASRLEAALANIGPVTWGDAQAYRNATRGATFLGAKDSQGGRRQMNALDSLWGEQDAAAAPDPTINPQTKDLWIRSQRGQWDSTAPGDQVVLTMPQGGPDANALASAAAINEKLPFDPGRAFADGFGVSQQGKVGNTLPLGFLSPDQLPPLGSSGVAMTAPSEYGYIDPMAPGASMALAPPVETIPQRNRRLNTGAGAFGGGAW